MTDSSQEKLERMQKLRQIMAANSAAARKGRIGTAKNEAMAFAGGDYQAAKAEAGKLTDGDYADVEQTKAETAAILEKNEDRKINRELRQKYATSVMRYLVGYSVFVAIILMLSGFNVFCFHLPENVLVYLVGSTAAAAIGLVFAVTNGLFKGTSS